jgi:hypothetical protein
LVRLALSQLQIRRRFGRLQKTGRNSEHKYSFWPRVLLGFCLSGPGSISQPDDPAGNLNMRNADRPFSPRRKPLDRQAQPPENPMVDTPVPDPFTTWEEPGEDVEADELDMPMDGDDPRWDACLDVFLADDDELDPMPQPGDFWTDEAGE